MPIIHPCRSYIVIMRSNIMMMKHLRRNTSSTPFRKTGLVFRAQLPTLQPLETYYNVASKALYTIEKDESIKNLRRRNRKYAAMSLDALMKSLTKPLTDVLVQYPKIFRSLHPYEAVVAELTVVSRVKAGNLDLGVVLQNIKALRTEASRIASHYASSANEAVSVAAAHEALEAGKEALQQLFSGTTSAATCIQDIISLHRELCRIPTIELDTPTIVLVGSPNVGKSSIVRAVSSGVPEVNDYPFTTRGVAVGHIVSEEERFQVMDTPGLLDRPAEKRNEMEKLTFASLAHLPTAVMYVIDPTGLCGEQSNLQAQLNIRKQLKDRFPRRPWIDVISKGDIEIHKDVREQLPPDALIVSVHSHKNIDQLKTLVRSKLVELQELFKEME